jgi:uncharacterized membrane protein YagU involved in acid resistance
VDAIGLIAGALLGTVVMTTVMEGAQALRWSRLSLPYLLGAMVTTDRRWIRIAGATLHVVNGVVFALGYALLFEVLGRSDWWIGMLAGAVHATAVLIVLLPLIHDIHPRMATEDHGPDPTPLLQPPGFVGLNYGIQTPISVIAAHLVYGGIVASLYRPLG